jgi:hypothetical protein
MSEMFIFVAFSHMNCTFTRLSIISDLAILPCCCFHNIELIKKKGEHSTNLIAYSLPLFMK